MTDAERSQMPKKADGDGDDGGAKLSKTNSLSSGGDGGGGSKTSLSSGGDGGGGSKKKKKKKKKSKVSPLPLRQLIEPGPRPHQHPFSTLLAGATGLPARVVSSVILSSAISAGTG